jgi:hypothetical protein
MYKKIIAGLALVLGGLSPGFSQVDINPYFVGQNEWLPVSVGQTSYGGSISWPDVSGSGTKIIRFGGIAADRFADPAFIKDYIDAIDQARSMGAEVMLQVPYYDKSTGHPFADPAAAATLAQQFVDLINNTFKKHVKYFSIGNEPNLQTGNTVIGYPNYNIYNERNGGDPATNTAPGIGRYIRTVAQAMKEKQVQISSTEKIYIIGPEFSYYNPGMMAYLLTTTNAQNIMDPIPSTSTAAGQYFVDVVSFHYYPFNAVARTRANFFTQADNLRSTLGSSTSGLIQMINNAPGRSLNTNCWIAITEANVSTFNPSGESESNPGSNTFIGGQFWADIMAGCMEKGVQFITFWSVKEGGSAADDNGYVFSHAGTYQGNAAGSKKPSYWHYKMMSKFKGKYYSSGAPAHSCYFATTVASGDKNLKAFASRDCNSIWVMILNENSSATNLPYEVRFDGVTTAPSSGVRVSFNMSLTPGFLHTGTIPSQTTLLLEYDFAGNPRNKYTYSYTTGTGMFTSDPLASPVSIINNNFPPSAVLAPTFSITQPTCSGSGNNGTISVSNSASFSSFTWKDQQGSTISTTSSAGTALYPGTYTVYLGRAGCTSPGIVSTAILNTSTPALSVTSAYSPSATSGCPTPGTQVTLTATAGLTGYSWYKGYTNTSASGTNVFSDTPPGSTYYSVTAQSATTGCKATTGFVYSLDVSNSGNNIIPDNVAVYAGNEVTIHAFAQPEVTTGGYYMYEWSCQSCPNGLSLNHTDVQDPVFKNSTPGTYVYNVKIKSPNNCNGGSQNKTVTVYNLSSTNAASYDAYMQDFWQDYGDQTVQASGPFPAVDQSPDIWIRQTQDTYTGPATPTAQDPPRYLNEHKHQQPKFVTQSANYPYIYVKVRNRGQNTVTGTVKVYFAFASTGEAWNSTAGSNGKFGDWEEANASFPDYACTG